MELGCSAADTADGEHSSAAGAADCSLAADAAVAAAVGIGTAAAVACDSAGQLGRCTPTSSCWTADQRVHSWVPCACDHLLQLGGFLSS